MRFGFLIPAVILSCVLAACGTTEGSANGPEIPVPPVIIAEPVEYQDEDPVTASEEPVVIDFDIPTHNEYIVSLEFEPETRMIRGMESVRYTNRTGLPLEELIFRIPLNAWRASGAGEPVAPYFVEFYGRIFRHGRDYGYMDILHVSLDSEELTFTLSGTVLIISLPRALEPDETMNIRIQFEAYIPKIAHRTGANLYAVWAGAFLPVEAVFGDDGWHTEPIYPVGNPFILDVANYTVEITTPMGYVVAGTGAKTETRRYDQMVTTFTASMVRGFAFAISPHFMRASATTPTGSTVVLYHYTPDLDTEYILSVATETMAFFEETIGAFPYGQLTIVETDMYRAGETFSAVIFMDSLRLRNSQNLTSLRHEIGQQWFSVIIGSNPIEEAWLSGGLTQFLHVGLLGQPREQREAIELSHHDLAAQIPLIRNEYSRRLSSRINVYESWGDYFLIQRRKGQIMFYALYREMGEENFRYLLREYYLQFAFQIASARDFIELADEIHGGGLRRFFNYWLNTVGLPDLPR